MAKTSTKTSKPATKTTSAKSTATGVATAPAVTIKTKTPSSAIPAAASHGANQTPSYEQIAQRAFEIWVAKGRPQGQDLENWKQAEADLMKGSMVAA